MRRRDFITAVGGAAAAWSFAAHAQQPAMPVMGFMHVGTADPLAPRSRFPSRPQRHGHIEGRNVAIEFRWAEGQNERLPAFAADLVHLPAAVIVTGGGEAPARAAKAATATIPIVFNVGGDPVKAGLVASLARPGGNADRREHIHGRVGGETVGAVARTFADSLDDRASGQS